MAKKFGAPSVKCPTCTKTVYPLEALKVQEKTFHKRCFRCKHCDNVCSLGNFAMYQGSVYCKPHFMRLFQERGTYNFAGDDADPTAPAFGCRRKASSEVTPSKADDTTEAAPTEKKATVEKTNVRPKPATEPKPKESDEAKPSNPFGEVKLRSTRDRAKAFAKTTSTASTAGEASEESQVEIRIDAVEPKEETSDSEDIAVKTEAGPRSPVADLMTAIRDRSRKEVQKAIVDQGIELLLERGPDGATPIEFAFANNNLECGRFLLDLIDSEIHSLKKAAGTA